MQLIGIVNLFVVGRVRALLDPASLPYPFRVLGWLVVAGLATQPHHSLARPNCTPERLPAGLRAQSGVLTELGHDLDSLLADAVEAKATESAALIVVRGGSIVYRGFAGRAKSDSIFDLASLTKVVATTSAIFRLVEGGRVELDKPVQHYLPWFTGNGKEAITLRELLHHTSGLPSVVWRGARSDGRQKILERIQAAKLAGGSASAYRYSDLGFILLGEIVAQVTGKSLSQVASTEIFDPLGMCHTGFAPSATLRSRLISPWPTGINPGEVYDPLAARLGGVAGHAGLFATVDDLARFGQMMLNGGVLGGARIFRPGTVRAMTQRFSVEPGRQRGLGWRFYREDERAGRGALSPQAYGHTGFTGTSLWIDPAHALVVVLLTNRTFYEPYPSVGPLRRRVHGAIRSALLQTKDAGVKVGLDHLVRGGFGLLKGKRVGLIANATAVDGRGRWIVDLLDEEPTVELKALFAVEHGLEGRVDRKIKDGMLKRGNRQIPVYTLFGQRRRPTPETLKDLDVLVFDLATIGVRYYTYLSTLGWAMEEAAKRKIPFVVLDRPDPLGGRRVEGPLSSATRRTSTNFHPLPVRYAMTTGEVARYFNAQRKIGAALKVVPVSGWRRGQTFDGWGKQWINPSPNIRSWRQALLYAGVGLLEGTNVSVGRGTKAPFEWFGAPWIGNRALAANLNALNMPGVYFVPQVITPTARPYKGKSCKGVRLVVTDIRRVRPVAIGLELAAALIRLHGGEWQMKNFYKLINHPKSSAAILSGKRTKTIRRSWEPELRRFRALRKRYLLY